MSLTVYSSTTSTFFDHVERARGGGLGGWVKEPLDVELDCLGVKGGRVVELDALAQVQGPVAAVVGLLPGLGEVGQYLASLRGNARESLADQQDDAEVGNPGRLGGIENGRSVPSERIRVPPRLGCTLACAVVGCGAGVATCAAGAVAGGAGA